MTDGKQNESDEVSSEGSPAGGETTSDAKQYNSTFESPKVVSVGDNTTIYNGLGYTDIKQIVKDVLEGVSNEASRPHDGKNSIKQEIAENLQAQRQSAADMDDTFSRLHRIRKLPQTLGEIKKWFYELPLRKQYIIPAVAILHGGRNS